MLIEVGNYKLTKIGLLDGVRKVTILNFPWSLSYNNTIWIINQTGLNNNNHGIKLAQQGSFNGALRYATIDTAPAVVLNPSTGGITIGTHVYASSFVTFEGEESLAGPISSVITVNASFGQVNVTPFQGPSGTSSRNIYRSLANTTTPLYLLGTINDNSVGSIYLDTAVDNSTLTTAPTISNNYDFDYQVIGFNIPPMSASDFVFAQFDIPDDTKDIYQGVMLVQEQTPALLPAADTEVASISDSNLVAAANPYWRELIVSNYPNFIVQLKATCSSAGTTVLQLYATLDPAAVTPADGAAISTLTTDWVPMTATIFGQNSLVVPAGSGTFVDIRNWSIDLNQKPMIYDRYLLAITCNSSINTLQANIRKF